MADVRLRRRRSHGAARVPRVAPARRTSSTSGTPRASPTGTARRTSCSPSRASSPRCCSSAAPSCSWWPATRPRRRRCPRSGRSSTAGCRSSAWSGRRRAWPRAPRSNGRVGLIATPATVASGAYARALAEAAPEAELHAVATAELAPLIQEGGEVDHRVLDCVESACRPLRAAGVDTVILGCTHYPLVRPVLQRELGRGITIVSSGEAIAEDVHRPARASSGSPTTRTAAAATASSPAATRRSSAASARASCSCRSARSTTWTWSACPARGRRRERAPAPGRTAAARPTCARSPSAPASCAAPPARR